MDVYWLTDHNINNNNIKTSFRERRGLRRDLPLYWISSTLLAFCCTRVTRGRSVWQRLTEGQSFYIYQRRDSHSRSTNGGTVILYLPTEGQSFYIYQLRDSHSISTKRVTATSDEKDTTAKWNIAHWWKFVNQPADKQVIWNRWQWQLCDSSCLTVPLWKRKEKEKTSAVTKWRCKYTIRWCYKGIQSLIHNHLWQERSETAREWRTALYQSDQQQ